MAKRASPQRLQSWSFSTHNRLRECPARVKYAKIDKLPDPSGPAAERGNRVHDVLERYAIARREGEEGFFPPEFRAWKPGLDALLDSADDVKTEQKIGFDLKRELFTSTSWDEGPGRAKLDLTTLHGERIQIVDYKTGREYPYHAAQLRLYATLAFTLYDWCDSVKVENWYLDEPGSVKKDVFTRKADLAALLQEWRLAMVEDLSRTKFPAQRNPYCKYCPFSSRKGGPCVEG